MKEYFKLQFVLTNRRLNDFGVAPIVGYLLLAVAFLALSVYLFARTEFAQYLYVLLAIGLISVLSDIKRNDFLKTCLKDREYTTTRIIENLVVSAPFLTFLGYKQLFFSFLILVTIAVCLGLMSFKANLNFTIPTPFYSRPFEFTVGFRNSFFLFAIAYILTFISIAVDNFNLGVFSLLLVFLTTYSYYAKPENDYYVWSFSLSPQHFLRAKIGTAIMFASSLCLPVILTLATFYFREVGMLIFYFLIGCTFLVIMVLAKYASYPNEITLPHGLMIGVSVYFPPLLFGLVPYFYYQSVKHLKQFLI